MARFFPDPLVGAFAPEVLQVAKALRAITGDDFIIWARLPLEGAERLPDFLIVHANKTAFAVSVSGLTDRTVAETVHGSLFSASISPEEARRTLAAEERGRVTDFTAWAATAHEAGLQNAESIAPGIHGIVIFPNVSHDRLREVWKENPAEGCYWLGEKYTSSESVAKALRRLATGDLNEKQLLSLRARFSPEMVVPPHFSARGVIRRTLSAELTPMLLDYEQEAWTKNRLRLSEEAAAVAEAPAPYGESTLVTGVAGSGKSLVLLFRACTQAQLHPGSRALVLTHNKALRRELETRFGELGRSATVEWETFFSWIDAGLSGVARRFEIVQYKERGKLIADAVRTAGEAVSESWLKFLADEFDWMQDRAITEREVYLKAERTGRGAGLTNAQRDRVYLVYEHYRKSLADLQQEDWSGRALRFWRGVTTGEIPLRNYDYIYVDEAQFFAPVWLRTLQASLKPGTGRLLLAADPTQGFLKRRQSWVACGLDLRGRSTRLRKSYRNSRPILRFAANFYRARLGQEDESDLNLPDAAELGAAESGEPPRIIELTSRQDELTRVSNEVHEFLRSGSSAEAILILVGIGTRMTEVMARLSEEFGPARVADARQTSGRGKLRVCSVDAATGLEAPIVFLIGAAELLELEDDLQLSADQRDELRRDNTRRLYMGFTRAASRLVITWVGRLPPEVRV